MSDIETLLELEPFTPEIVSIVHREDGRKSEWHRPSPLDKSWIHADYLARVDGEDYVVTVGDAEMKRGNVLRVLHDTTRYDSYATYTEQSQKWIARNIKLHHLTRLFRPLYEGYVRIEPRDAFDIYETNSDLSRGMVGYTLRRGRNAILHTTGNFTEDPEFFLRAVHAVNLATRINEKSHFTALEEQQFAEIHHPIIDRLERLVQRDGLSATEAIARYADQYEEIGDISRHIARILDINVQLEPATKMLSMFATYHLGEGNHFMIEKRGNKRRSSIKVTHEYLANGEAITRTYEQPWIYPKMIIVDVPSKGIANSDYHDKRLFALSETDALDLNALIQQL